MKVFRAIAVIFFIALVSPAVYAAVIDKVEISGNKRVPETRIRQYTVKPGEEFDPAALNASIKRLHETGFFLEVNVDASVRGTDFIITYVVQETPLIAGIQINGNKNISTEKLRDALAVKTNEAINFTKVGTSIKNIQDLYEKDRYYNVEISHRVEYRNDVSVNLIFDIVEGETSRVYNIWFYGNETFDTQELRDAMRTREKDFWSKLNSSGTLMREVIEMDRELLRQFYLNHGFLMVEIGEPEIAFQENLSRMNYLVRINEGPRYTVKSVNYRDSLGLFTRQQIEDRTEFRAGEYADIAKYRKDIYSITDLYTEIGYARADVDPQMELDNDALTVDVTYVVEEGPLVNINRIEFVGNNKTRDNVLRREFDIQEGELYNSALLREGQYNLYATGYFDDIRLSDRFVTDNLTDIIVSINEKKNGSLNLGIAYSTADQVIGKVEFSQANIFGLGSTATALAEVSSSKYNFVLRYTEPWIFDNPYSVSTDLYSIKREYDDYTKTAIGASIRLGHQPIKRRLFLNYTLSHEEATIKDISSNASRYIRDQEGLRIINSITPSITYSKLNNNLDPSDGIRLQASAKYAGTFLGGNADFVKGILEGTYYQPLTGPWVGVLHGELGQIWNTGDYTLPIDERFYLGGIYSVRGFKNREISPKDENGESYGGDKYYQFSAEVWRPIFEDNLVIRGVLFFDMGQVFEEGESLFSRAPRKTVGMGIRFFTPMGLLRLEYGYKLDKKSDEDAYVWEFSIGSSF